MRVFLCVCLVASCVRTSTAMASSHPTGLQKQLLLLADKSSCRHKLPEILLYVSDQRALLSSTASNPHLVGPSSFQRARTSERLTIYDGKEEISWKSFLVQNDEQPGFTLSVGVATVIRSLHRRGLPTCPLVSHRYRRVLVPSHTLKQFGFSLGNYVLINVRC